MTTPLQRNSPGTDTTTSNTELPQGAGRSIANVQSPSPEDSDKMADSRSTGLEGGPKTETGKGKRKRPALRQHFVENTPSREDPTTSSPTSSSSENESPTIRKLREMEHQIKATRAAASKEDGEKRRKLNPRSTPNKPNTRSPLHQVTCSDEANQPENVALTQTSSDDEGPSHSEGSENKTTTRQNQTPKGTRARERKALAAETRRGERASKRHEPQPRLATTITTRDASSDGNRGLDSPSSAAIPPTPASVAFAPTPSPPIFLTPNQDLALPNLPLPSGTPEPSDSEIPERNEIPTSSNLLDNTPISGTSALKRYLNNRQSSEWPPSPTR